MSTRAFYIKSAPFKRRADLAFLPAAACVHLETREVPAPRKGQTATGYGMAMPLPYMVRYAGRWHRVLCACVSNSGSCYIKTREGEVLVDA